MAMIVGTVRVFMGLAVAAVLLRDTLKTVVSMVRIDPLTRSFGTVSMSVGVVLFCNMLPTSAKLVDMYRVVLLHVHRAHAISNRKVSGHRSQRGGLNIEIPS